MKTSFRVMGATLLLASVLSVAVAAADVLTVSPSRALVLPADKSGMTRVALVFDFSGMRQGPGQKVDQAYLEWPLEGVARDSRSEFSAFVLPRSWNVETAAAAASLAEQQDPTAAWEIDPSDFERGEGGVLRLDLRDAVADWVRGSSENHGLVICTPHVPGNAMADQLSGAQLTVLYGFVR